MRWTVPTPRPKLDAILRSPGLFFFLRAIWTARSVFSATADEQCVGTDEECVGPLLHECRKGCIDAAIRAGGEDFDLPSDGRSRRLHFCDEGLSDKRIVGVDERGKARLVRV